MLKATFSMLRALEVRLPDVACLGSDGSGVLIVGERYEAHIGSLESLLRLWEAIGVGRYHAHYLKPCGAKSLDSLQRRASCGDKILNDNDFGTLRQRSLDKVSHAVVLGFERT